MANKWKSASAFMKDTLGKKVDTDGVYGAQCVDYFTYFTKEQCGKWFATGNGCATGYWKVTKSKVVALGFKAISKAADVKAGDWLITKETKAQPYGHIGIIKEVVTKGKTVKLQAQNNDGKCGAVNVINYSLTNFLGAFRYEKWPTTTSTTTEKKTTTTTTTSGIKVGSKVTLTTWKDVNATPLYKTRNYYYVSQIDGNKVLLRADNAKTGTVYAWVKKTNLKEVK